MQPSLATFIPMYFPTHFDGSARDASPLEIVVGFIVYAVLLAAAAYGSRAAWRRMKRLSQGDAAFDFPVSVARLRAGGDTLEQELQGKVAAVTIAYDSVNARSLLIDVNGEPHDLETGPAERVRDNARWVAERLGVAFNDD